MYGWSQWLRSSISRRTPHVRAMEPSGEPGPASCDASGDAAALRQQPPCSNMLALRAAQLRAEALASGRCSLLGEEPVDSQSRECRIFQPTSQHLLIDLGQGLKNA